MYELHIANKNYSSWSLRPWLLMRQLAIPFNEHLAVFSGGSNHEAFRVFSPSGRVPCLHDGGQVVWDSLAIVEYLAERHPGVWPAVAPARAWARCASAEMHSGFAALRTHCSMNCGLRMALSELPADLVADIARIDELWCEGLQRFGGPFLAGSAFCAVDAFFAPVAVRIRGFDLHLSDTALAYADRLLHLAAMREWYDAALREPWRETEHEKEVLAAGRLVADLRVGG
ncbi:MAG: glutathione S-transferase family protein [Pseudomonadales bacterium]|jgi:glutathione S-transferase|nr:glutathione S-transferase family protein [Gammaproteobacteria bacterium]MBP6052375.1 glutathione S-transferase family protein [Pseudomonadales bacterium]MBK6584825.1 glutathione S-transferase family protein [Gammaproteobacteria bacterium]MBK7170000.1 glutathione S-transferase family protein [Gammaproteobacteria bacterium]MBK7519665.1 glutathione S-transferase family protein [Gammaproteobacteria bacterium]